MSTVDVVNTVAVVGASLAGARAAEALRDGGYEGRIVLIGAEREPPYERPPLSKELLDGSMDPEEVYLRPAPAWDDQDVELLLGTPATRLVPSERSVELADGRAIRADRVVLATGCRPRRLDVPGAHLDGVHYLRTIADSLAIRRSLVPGAPVVIIGAGFIGAEVAATARLAGCEVTMLEVADVPLGRVLGPELGALYAAVHRERGVDLRTGTGVECIVGDGDVRGVVTTAGSRIEAACVVVGVGAEPVTEIAGGGSGVAIDNGILVDDHCETTVSGVYAAGDVARFPDPATGQQVRIEHWHNAQLHGRVAAAAILGREDRIDEVAWFWSNQYEFSLQLAGHPSPEADLVVRGDLEALDFTAFFVAGERVIGVCAVNRPREVRQAMALIAGKRRVDGAILRDEAMALAEIGAVA